LTPGNVNKKELTELDICDLFITPAIKDAGWDQYTQIRREVTLAGIGTAAMVDQDIDFAFYVSLTLLKPKRNLIFPKYLELYPNSPLGKDHSYKKTLGRGVSAGNLNLSLIRGFELPHPPINEQRPIVLKVEEFLLMCDRKNNWVTKVSKPDGEFHT
jgi:restriction endonuclease S subunit